jgi:hypothetical protein
VYIANHSLLFGAPGLIRLDASRGHNERNAFTQGRRRQTSKVVRQYKQNNRVASSLIGGKPILDLLREGHERFGDALIVACRLHKGQK